MPARDDRDMRAFEKEKSDANIGIGSYQIVTVGSRIVTSAIYVAAARSVKSNYGNSNPTF